MPNPQQFGFKGLFSALLMVLTVAYPFAVYKLIGNVSPSWFAGFLLILFVVRFVFIGNLKKIKDWMMLAVVTAFCLTVAMLDSEPLLKFYPVLMNFGMGLVFIVSLSGERSLIETLARAGGKTPPPEARGYLRNLSLLWGVFLIINGAISVYTAWYTSLSTWALYNGFISYMLIAAFAAGEWVYRGYYKKTHNIVDD